MHSYINSKTEVAKYAFDSLADVARYIETAPKTWTYTESRNHRATQDWDLGTGYDKAWDMARWGWPEGAERAQRDLKAFNAGTPRPLEHVDFYGYRPHVPRFCAGAPDSMIRHAPDNGAGKVLTLYVSTMCSAAQNARYLANYGLGIAQYVYQLEMQGTRVELHGCSSSECSGWELHYSWLIKRADQPLDLAVVAFAIGHPAMFRRLWFALCERSPARQMEGYGYCENTHVRDMLNPAPGAVVLNGMRNANSYARTIEDALEYVETQIDLAQQ
jgi:hypothetical protein